MGEDGPMTLILKITDEGSQYSDQLHDLLGEFGLDPAVDDELDDLSLLPAYVLAGASIRTEAHSHGTHMHVIAINVEIAEELEAAFYDALGQVLEAGDEDDEDDD
jgi:hypothetical protein